MKVKKDKRILLVLSLFLLCQVNAFAQRKVVGKVTESKSGDPLVGVNIAIKGTTTGTFTDSTGAYSLQVKSLGDTLVYSYIGYKKQTIPISGQSLINVRLKVNVQAGEELTVVGYGKQKKISVVGAQSTIKPSKLETTPTRSLSTMLAGKLSGVIAVQRTGEPGGNNDAQVWIRGISTFDQNLSHPLVLVDGVPRDYNNINVEDIESFTVLKDATATAVYGVRGANGVILIHTKKGHAGKPQVKFRYNDGVTMFTRLPDFADGVTFMKAANEALTTRGQKVRYKQDAIEKTQKQTDPYLYPDVDWYDAIFNKRGHTRQAHLNISGGAEDANYYVSASFFNNVGLFKTRDISTYSNQISDKRYNMTANLNLDITKTTKIKLGVKGHLNNGHFPGYNRDAIYGNAYYSNPVKYPPEYPNGEVPNVKPGDDLYNPYATLTHTGYRSYFQNTVNSNIKLTQSLDFLIEGLSINTLFAFDVHNSISKRRTKTPDSYTATGRDSTGALLLKRIHTGQEFLGYDRVNNGDRKIYTRTQLQYNHDFGYHHVGGMFLYKQSDFSDTHANGFVSSLPHRFRGFAGRLTYDYKNTYFVEFDAGYNGSENFAPDNRYGFFPSVGAGWNISSEPFFKSFKNIFQLLKLRFSYGFAGSSNIPGRRFAYIATVSNPTGYIYGKGLDNYINGRAVGEYASNVSWETSKKMNIGLDIWALRHSLKLTLDAFKSHRSDIFLRRDDIPGFAGITANPFGNTGIIDNKGFDGSLKYNGKIGSVQLQLLGNATFNRNTRVQDGGPPWKFPWLEHEGRKVSQRFGYIALGLFKSKEEIKNSPAQTGDVRPGDIKFKDISGDGKINPDDRMPIGYGSVPEWTYGFGFTVNYKSFTLSTFFQGVGNVDIYLNGEGFQPFSHGISRGNLFNNINDRWTKKNPDPNAFYPRLSVGDVNQNYHISTWWLRNGRYLRLKNAQLSYHFPSEWLEGAHIRNAQIFLAGRNILTFSPFKLWDPELGNGRGSTYPLTKSFSVGLEIDF